MNPKGDYLELGRHEEQGIDKEKAIYQRFGFDSEYDFEEQCREGLVSQRKQQRVIDALNSVESTKSELKPKKFKPKKFNRQKLRELLTPDPEPDKPFFGLETLVFGEVEDWVKDARLLQQIREVDASERDLYKTGLTPKKLSRYTLEGDLYRYKFSESEEEELKEIIKIALDDPDNAGKALSQPQITNW